MSPWWKPTEGITVSTEVVSTIVVVAFVIGLVLIGWFLVALVRALAGSSSGHRNVTRANDSDVDSDGMNPGDYYNGPHGYSPMTGYPQTQYGSGFDPEAQWNHEHEE
ncbi:MAG: hypothetical protein EBR52_02240 [Microbacteriaceae bacterium]|nr:hypothetical protein [Microbacteriaceae bacterium]